MTRTELSDLDRNLARGPRLIEGAVLGAGVGAVMGWLSGDRITPSIAHGAVGGVFVGLLLYGYEQWSSTHGHNQLGEVRHVAGAIAPFPLYAPSVTYPWSAH